MEKTQKHTIVETLYFTRNAPKKKRLIKLREILQDFLKENLKGHIQIEVRKAC